MRFFPAVLASLLGTLIAFGAVFFFLLLLVAGLASSTQPTPTVKSNSVLVVSMSGLVPEIVPENPFQMVFRGPEITTLHEVTRAIREAADDDRIAGLWLKPSGIANAWASLEEVRSAVEIFRASGKPILASSGAQGYSEKDYFIATASDLVVSPPAAHFELNGLAVIAQFVKRLFDKLDIEAQAVRAGSFKSATEPFMREHASEQNLEQLNAFLDAHNEVFLGEIAARRGLERSTIDQLLERGDVTNSEGALEVGLIDSLCTDHQVSDYWEALVDSDGELKTISASRYAMARRGGGSGGTVAVVNAFGTIVPGRSSRDSNPVFGGMNVGSSSLAARLEDLRKDDSVDAIVIRINSPGGSAAASDVIWHAIKRTAVDKPVIASLGDVAASGGYYIAAAADTIVAQKTTLTGSIGVFTLLLDVSGLMEDKLGLTHDAVKTGPHADMFSGLRALSNRERDILQADVDRTYDRFKRLVSEGRSLQLSEVEAAAEGRIWAGSDAFRLGLVDQFGGLREATTIAAGMAGLGPAEFRVRTYPRHRGLFEQLSEWIETTSTSAITKLSEHGSGDWFLRHAVMLNMVSELHGQPQALLPMSVTVE